MSCHAAVHARASGTSFGHQFARKRSNILLKTSRSCLQVRAALSTSDVTSLGPESGHDVEFRGQDDNGRLTVMGKMQLVSCSPEQVYDAVTDYARAPDIFQNVAESVVTRDDGVVKVNQECKWKFLIFQGTFGIALEVDEEPEKNVITFKLAKSAFMRDFEGSWELEKLPGGGCHVTHVLNITPTLAPPKAFENYTSKIFIRQVDGILGDLRTALEA